MLELRPGVAAACESPLALAPARVASLAGPFGPLRFYVDRYGLFFLFFLRRDGPAEAGRATPRVRRPARGGGRAAARRRDSGGARPSGRTCRARPGRGPTAPRLPRPGEGRAEGRGAGGLGGSAAPAAAAPPRAAEPGPLGTSCVRGKRWPLAVPAAGSSKWRTRWPGRAGG